MSIADPVSYPTKDGIGCRFPLIHYVKIDEPDAHEGYFRGVDRAINIERCPYLETGGQALVQPYHKASMLFWQVIEPIHAWIEKAGYQYDLDRRWIKVGDKDVFGWVVGFREKSEAAHFKLAWAYV